MKHDVNYRPENFNNIDKLNQKVDDLRLTALAALEELEQTLELNQVLGENNLWCVSDMRQKLEKTIESLRTEI